MELREFVQTVRRSWLIVAAAVAVALAVAVGAGVAGGARYRSTSVLFVAFDATTGQDTADQRIGSYVELLTGPRIANAVAKAAGLPARRVRDELTAERQPGTSLITLTAVDPSRERAAKVIASAASALRGVLATVERTGPKAAITVAQQPVTEPAPRNLPRNAALAALLGLVAGVCLVAVRRSIGGPVTGATDVQHRFGVDTVETLGAHEADGEAYRRLRTRLRARAAPGGRMSLLVTGADRDDRAAEVCWSLAEALAEGGTKVAVLDADLRAEHPAAAPGLADVLAGDRSIVDLLRTRGPGPVSYLGPGPVPDDPGSVLASPALADAIIDLERMFDVVLVLAPPVLGSADAQLIATLTGGVVVSVRAGRTPATAFDRALETLRSVGAEVVAALVHTRKPSRLGASADAPAPDPEPVRVRALRSERTASLG